MESQYITVIDGREFSFTPGESILHVAERNKIHIPTLCYLKRATPSARCGVCLVEVEGEQDPVRSCSFPVRPHMVITTDSPRLIQRRRENLEHLMISGRHNCLFQNLNADSWADFEETIRAPEEQQDLCPAYGACRLQELAIQYQVPIDPSRTPSLHYPIENVNPFIIRDFSRCVLCGRCVKACNEIQVNNVIRFDNNETPTKVVTEGDRTLRDSTCVFCGECIQACPVGALIWKQNIVGDRLPANIRKVRTTCAYCGVGCQIHLHERDNTVIQVTGVENVGPNYGSLCVKGRFGYDFIHDERRLRTPLVRVKGELREASWDEALNLIAERLLSTKKESGPDSMGLLCSARITNEENYVAQKFVRAVIGTNNIDHCARL